MERRTAVPVAAAMALGSMVVAAAASFGLLGSSRDPSPAPAEPAAAGAPAPEVEIRYEDVIVPVLAPVVADTGRVALAAEGADPVMTTVTAPGSGRDFDDDDRDDDDRDDDDRDDDDRDDDRSGRGRGGDDDRSGRGRGGDDE